MGTLFGEATPSALFFASLVGRGQLLQERICSHRSKFFPLRDDPSLEVLRHIRKANRKSLKLFAFVKVAEQHGGVPVHLSQAM